MKTLTITCILMVLFYSTHLFSQTKNSTNDPRIEWMAEYGSELTSVKANAFDVDSAGNVYLTFMIDNNFVTMKYNSEGIEQWVSTYNGPGDSIDYPTALAVDDSGNVFVTGNSFNKGTGYDYATIKYNSSGIEQWIVRYNMTGNFDYYQYTNFAVNITLDIIGNVYITGRQTTIKYNSSGTQMWSTLSGAKYISVDNNGNVYVIASSYCDVCWDSDYKLVKYNSSGVEQWIESFDGTGADDYPIGIAVDTAENIYFAGLSGTDIWTGGDYSYVTAKYDPTGVQQWLNLYNGISKDMVVDVTGNVYVTGSEGTVKYNTEGVQQWAVTSNANSIAIDVSGNLYVTGNNATVKYSNAGVQQWTVASDGNFIDIDASSNVYITGSATVKFNSTGIQQWSFTIVPATRVNEISESDKIKIYPNPTIGLFEISINEPLKSDYRIEVFNILGGIIQTNMKQKSETSTQIDLTDNPSGMYMVRLKSKNEFYQCKIIKQ